MNVFGDPEPMVLDNIGGFRGARRAEFGHIDDLRNPVEARPHRSNLPGAP